MSDCEATPEVKAIIRAMAKNRVEAGITDAADLVDSIHEEIHGHTPLWKSEIADIISGYGEVRKQTKSEMQTRLAAIKAELRGDAKRVDAESQPKVEKPTPARKPTPEEARITARQTQLKNEIEDLNQRIAARDTSKPERMPVESPEITDLKKQRDALKSRLELMEPSPPATRPLDPNEAKNKAAQTAMKHQIDALTRRLAERDTSPPKKPTPQWTAETQDMRRRRDVLAQRYADMAKSDRAETTAQTRLQGQIDELNRRIAVGDTAPRAKTATVDSEAVTALKQRLAAARQALDAITPKDPERSPEEIKNATRRTQLTKEMADLQRKLDTGDFSKPVKNKPQYDEQTLALQSERDALRAKADKAIRNLERANQSTPAKVADFFLAFRRSVILSSVHTIAKLTGAAAMRTVSTPIEEGIGSVLRMIPGIRSIDAMAPREGGGLSIRAEAQAAKRTFSKETLKEMYRVATEGSGVNDALYGKDKDPHFKMFDWVGQIHGALKTPAKRNEFFRSVEKRGAFLRKQMTAEGKTPAEIDAQMQSPVTQAMLGAKAYVDSQQAIFMDDNWFVDMYRSWLARAQTVAFEGSVDRAAAKTVAKVSEYILPIVKIPSNFVGEVTSYTAGGAKAALQVALAKGVKNLRPEQADYIMRNLKKQTVGAALLALGYFNPSAFGGYYQPGETRGKDDPEAGGMKVLGRNIPKYVLHNPALFIPQLGATIRHIADSGKRGEGTVGAGVFGATKGLVGEVPFFDSPVRLYEGLKSYSGIGKYVGENVRDAFLPPDLQRYAKATDPEQVFKRRPRDGVAGFLDAMKEGIPSLREQVPLSSYKSLSLDQRMDAWDEMTPAQRESSGMAAHIMASARRDASKLTSAQQARLERIAEQAQ